jgi:DNA (cytosine-5)-methyltransferase 1
VASREGDPRQVLFADETSARKPDGDPAAFGFYWTEGNKGVGWAVDAVPTLKGGSKLGIPSPPAVWQPSAALGQAIVRPDIRAAERLQGFPAGWTDHVAREGHRWKLVGNAVTVNTAAWVGSRLAEPADSVDVPRRPLDELQRWPAAAAGVGGAREGWSLSERPVAVRRRKVGRILASHGSHPLSAKATAGFAKRLAASNLRAGGVEFHDALRAHVAAVS